MLKKEQLVIFFPESPKDFLINSGLYSSSKLVKIANKIDWDSIISLIEPAYSKKTGRPAISIRIMVGLLFAKYLFGNISDEQLFHQLKTNVELQYFCGIQQAFNIPFKQKDSIAKFRKRLSEAVDIYELQKTFLLPIISDTDKRKLKYSIQDSVVVEENISYPTDSSLLYSISKHTTKLVKKAKLLFKDTAKNLKSLGKNTIKNLYHKISFSKKKVTEETKQITKKLISKAKLSLNATKKVKQIIKENIQDLGKEAKKQAEKLLKKTEEHIRKAEKIIKDVKKRVKGEKVKNALLSYHNGSAYIVKKGKSGKNIEIGRKVHVISTGGNISIIGKICDENEHDSKGVKENIKIQEEITGVKVEIIGGDKGYRGESSYDIIGKLGLKNRIQGTKERKRLSKQTRKKRYKRRSYIETMISHFVIGRRCKKTTLGEKNFKIHVIMGNIVSNYIRYI